MDVVEIDAASNTSVDNVRDLRERVGYASGRGPYKVYIVDEVHRLSGAAFDAFLKTLEEPPPHVIFVFASTEPHKVPETITSRCQRFDFRRISSPVALLRLRYVAAQEEIDVSDEALRLIVQFGRGSLRDALGLLDQVHAYTSGAIGDLDVRFALGLADPMIISRLSDNLIRGETGQGLSEFHQFCGEGGDPNQLVTQMVDYWRSVLMAVAGASVDESSLDPALAQSLASHASAVNSAEAVAVLRALTEQEFSAKVDIPAELSFELRYVQSTLALQTDPALGENGPEELGPPPPQSSLDVQAEPAMAPASMEPPDGDSHQSKSPDVGGVSAGNSAIEPSILLGTTEDLPAEPPPQVDGVLGSAPSSESGSVEGSWPAIVLRMRPHSPSLQAVLRSGYVLKVDAGEVTIGFLGDWHCKVLSEVRKRKLVERVIEEVVGVSYRVHSVLTTREEVERIRGSDALPEDDGFLAEAQERLRAFHARQLGNGYS